MSSSHGGSSFTHSAASHSDTINYYALLGVSSSASTEEIKRKYKRLTLTFHPDRFQEPDQKVQARERLEQVMTAYAILSDERKRKLYDELGEEALKVLATEKNEVGAALKTTADFMREFLKSRRNQHREYIRSRVTHTGAFTLGLVSSRQKGSKFPSTALSELAFVQEFSFPLSPISKLNLKFNGEMSVMRPSCSMKLGYSQHVMAVAAILNVYANLNLIQSTFGIEMNDVELSSVTTADFGLKISKYGFFSSRTPDTTEGQPNPLSQISPNFHAPTLYFTLNRLLSDQWIGSFGMELVGKAIPSISDLGFQAFGIRTEPRVTLAIRSNDHGLDQDSDQSNQQSSGNNTQNWSFASSFVTSRSEIGADVQAGYKLTNRTSVHLSAAALSSFGVYPSVLDSKSGELTLDAILHPYASLQVIASRIITQLMSVHVGFDIGLRGVQMIFAITRYGQTIRIPISISPIPTLWSSLCGSLGPFIIGLISDVVILEPRRRKIRAEMQAKKKAENDIRTKAAKERALADCKLMAEEVSRKRDEEEAKGGLVIVQAFYGRRPTEAEASADEEEMPGRVDVTVPLQYMIQNSQIQIPAEAPKSQLVGFYDPVPDEEKFIEVVYLFKHKLHRTLVGDFDALRMPLPSHKMD